MKAACTREVAAEVERSGKVTEQCRGRIHRGLSLVTGRGPECGKESRETLGFCLVEWIQGTRKKLQAWGSRSLSCL